MMKMADCRERDLYSIEAMYEKGIAQIEIKRGPHTRNNCKQWLSKILNRSRGRQVFIASGKASCHQKPHSLRSSPREVNLFILVPIHQYSIRQSQCVVLGRLR